MQSTGSHYLAKTKHPFLGPAPSLAPLSCGTPAVSAFLVNALGNNGCEDVRGESVVALAVALQ